MSEYSVIDAAHKLRLRLPRASSKEATALVRKALADAYEAGYTSAHEWQMRARIADQRACEMAHGPRR